MYDTTADEMSEMKPTDSTLINDSSIIKWVQISNNGVNMLNSRHGKITYKSISFTENISIFLS